MHVAVVSREPPPASERDGARRLHRVADGLVDRGHDVTIYCIAWWETSRRRLAVDGLQYEAVTVESPHLFLSRLPGVLARSGPDAVLVSPSPPAAAVAAAIGGAFARAPVVCDWYGDEPGADGSLIRPLASRMPTRVVTPSELHRTRVREYGASEERTTVLSPGIDFSLVESADPADYRDVVYARRLDADANLESLLLALAELRGLDEWTATVLGDGPERAAYERQARDLSIGDRVEFLGECDRGERVAVYRGAQTFVQTARRTHFAEELLWALASGCVGVVEYQGDSSAHELVERRERGLRVTDSETLDDAIEASWRQEFRDVDEDFRQFDHEAITRRYLDIFRECAVDV